MTGLYTKTPNTLEYDLVLYILENANITKFYSVEDHISFSLDGRGLLYAHSNINDQKETIYFVLSLTRIVRITQK